MRRLRLLFKVQRLHRGNLHSRGSLVVGDAGVEFVSLHALLGVLRVELLQQFEITSLSVATKMRRRLEIEDPWLARANDGALIERRQPAIGPVEHSLDRQPRRIGHHHISGQLLCLGAKAIGDPASQSRPTALDAPGVHRVDRLTVVVDTGGHRTESP